MSIIIPFRALRPHKQFAALVASVPYDVVNVKEARNLVKNNSLNFLHVEKSEIDLPDDADGEAVYQKAKANLEKMVSENIMFQDEDAHFYVYRQRLNNREQYGIVGGISVPEYEKGLIKKHELTRMDKEIERTRHVATVNAQTGPVFIAYRRRNAIDKLVQSISAGEPEYDFTADDGINHTVWVVRSNDYTCLIKDEFSLVDAFYIADGHHRAAAAATVGKIRRESNPEHRGDEQYNFTLAVIFPHDQLQIIDYNRIVKDLNGMNEADFLAKVKECFDITPDFAEKQPGRNREFGMYLSGRWYKLACKDDGSHHHDPVKGLDVSLLQDFLLEPVLGIHDPRTDKRIEFVGGIRGMKELEDKVNSGDFSVAFSLYPTRLDEMMAVADAGKVMPPKSTWFEPKLRSGLFVHFLV